MQVGCIYLVTFGNGDKRVGRYLRKALTPVYGFKQDYFEHVYNIGLPYYGGTFDIPHESEKFFASRHSATPIPKCPSRRRIFNKGDKVFWFYNADNSGDDDDSIARGLSMYYVLSYNGTVFDQTGSTCRVQLHRFSTLTSFHVSMLHLCGYEKLHAKCKAANLTWLKYTFFEQRIPRDVARLVASVIWSTRDDCEWE